MDGGFATRAMEAGAEAPPRQPRAHGEGRVAAAARAGRTEIARLRQAGCGKVLCPRSPGPGLQAVLVNTAGWVHDVRIFADGREAQVESAEGNLMATGGRVFSVQALTMAAS